MDREYIIKAEIYITNKMGTKRTSIKMVVGFLGNIDEKLIESKIRDVFMIAKKHRELRFTNFLDPAEQQLAQAVARGFPDMGYDFNGGYPDAERKIMLVYPSFLEDEYHRAPIRALRVRPKVPQEHPGHRDYLGAVLALGISREKIGDILLGELGADIIMHEEIMEYIGLNLTKVKNTGVDVEEISLKELLQAERPVKELKSTVASLRLDAAASIAFGISRSKMTPYIKGENLRLNFKVEKDPSVSVKQGDILSASRLGRAKIVEVGGKSKKGRTYIRIHRYINK
jgi:RNA-binding protein YlmH